MATELRWKFLFLMVLTIVSLYIALPVSNKPLFKQGEPFENVKIPLGIDLQGGAEVRYRVDTKDAETTRRAADVIARRIDAKGIKGPKINSKGTNEILVQIPGADRDTVEGYKKLFKTVGKLELKEVGSKEVHEQYRPDPSARSAPAGYELKKNTDRARGDSTQWPNTPYLWIKQTPILTGEHVTNASTGFGDEGQQVNFQLSEYGGKAFREATERLAGNGYIAILLDGQMKSCPFVKSAITSGSGVITMGRGGTQKEAEDLAITLRSGSLPAQIGKADAQGNFIHYAPTDKEYGDPESESFVGPTLGQDSINRGKWAAVIAFAGVALFMLIYYRLAGFVAVIALVMNVAFLLTLMILLGATLTLPGIAGIVLTVGMSVDANILIYERIREERAKGKTALQAYEAGHERAFRTIVDANLTTLSAGLILIVFGTGPVKGFGVTLSIGIATAFFTAVWCSKVMLRMLLTSGTLKEFHMMHFLRQTPNIRFTAMVLPLLIFTSLLSIGGMILTVATWNKTKGTDFSGGSVLVVNFNEKHSIDKIREAVRSITTKDAQGNTVAKYGDAEMQTMAPPEEGLKSVGAFATESTLFQIRTAYLNTTEIKQDFLKLFGDKLGREPFEELPESEYSKNPRDPYCPWESSGATEFKPTGFFLYLKKSPDFDFKKVESRIKDATTKDAQGNTVAVKNLVRKDEHTQEPMIRVEVKTAAESDRFTQLKILITRDDVRDDANKLQLVKNALKAANGLNLSLSPFVYEGAIGPAVAEEMTSATIWALIWSWIVMIIYVGFRFHSVVFGVAAVIALIHDAMIAIGAVAICHFLIPKQWGLNFEFSLDSLAAVLTVIGYSVHDTIVVYDRIRENLKLMRSASFREIIDASVNQTLSRTILTSLATWISVVLLYLVTLRSSGGVENLTFPLIVGIIIGTYSSIYIASPILLYWFKKEKPTSV